MEKLGGWHLELSWSGRLVEKELGWGLEDLGDGGGAVLAVVFVKWDWQWNLHWKGGWDWEGGWGRYEDGGGAVDDVGPVHGDGDGDGAVHDVGAVDEHHLLHL